MTLSRTEGYAKLANGIHKIRLSYAHYPRVQLSCWRPPCLQHRPTRLLYRSSPWRWVQVRADRSSWPSPPSPRSGWHEVCSSWPFQRNPTTTVPNERTETLPHTIHSSLRNHHNHHYHHHHHKYLQCSAPTTSRTDSAGLTYFGALSTYMQSRCPICEQNFFLVCTRNIVTELLSEAGADILALHRLNLHPFIIVLYKYTYLLHQLSPSVVRGAPFPVGALSTFLVCLWVNPALRTDVVWIWGVVHFFCERVVDRWNRFHQHVMSINAFKNGLDGTRTASIGFFIDWQFAKPWVTSVLVSGIRCGRTWYVPVPGMNSMYLTACSYWSTSQHATSTFGPACFCISQYSLCIHHTHQISELYAGHAYYHRQIHRPLGRDIACILVSAFVLYGTYYCNSIYSQVYRSLPLHFYSESLMLLLVSSVVFAHETMSLMYWSGSTGYQLRHVSSSSSVCWCTKR